jgi:hypothetical protein
VYRSVQAGIADCLLKKKADYLENQRKSRQKKKAAALEDMVKEVWPEKRNQLVNEGTSHTYMPTFESNS